MRIMVANAAAFASFAFIESFWQKGELRLSL
jgi:hypothetical protein